LYVAREGAGRAAVRAEREHEEARAGPFDERGERDRQLHACDARKRGTAPRAAGDVLHELAGVGKRHDDQVTMLGRLP